MSGWLVAALTGVGLGAVIALIIAAWRAGRKSGRNAELDRINRAYIDARGRMDNVSTDDLDDDAVLERLRARAKW